MGRRRKPSQCELPPVTVEPLPDCDCCCGASADRMTLTLFEETPDGQLTTAEHLYIDGQWRERSLDIRDEFA